MKRCVVAFAILNGFIRSLGAETLHVPGDHKTIRAALDTARAGDIVLVQAGTYRESIQIKKGVTLQSAGDDAKGKLGLKRAEATVLDGGGNAKEPAVVLAEGAVLDGFSITRVGTFDQKEYDKHYATQGEDLPDERGAVGADKDFPAVAILGVTATVRHCLVHDNGRAGIGCVGGKGAHNRSHIHKNIVYRNMGGGIGIAEGATPIVSSNVCYNNLRGGIGNRASAGLILRNECFDNVRAGIGIREGAKPIVRGNKCYKNRRAGIGIRMEGTEPVVEDNDCYENAMAGIGCRDGAAPLIARNRCFDNALAGIGSRDGARPHIVANKCFRNKEAGIGVQSGARAFIARNECYENEQAGIGQRSDAGTTLDGNHVHHNKQAGIGFAECKAGKSLVLNNRVVDNEQVAIGVHAGWKVRIADNVLAREGGLPPLVMVFKGAEAEIVANQFTGSGVAGVRAEGTIRVTSNAFTCPSPRKVGPPQFAVWALPGSDVVLLDNTITGWRHGLQADKAGVIAQGNQVSNYWQAGMRVREPASPLLAVGNTFWSKEGHAGLDAPQTDGLIEDNRVEKSDAPKK